MIVVAVARSKIPPKTGGFTVNLRWGSGTAPYRNTEYETWLNDMKTFFERIITSSRTIAVDIRFQNLGSSGPIAQCGPGDGSDNILGQITSFLSDIDVYSDKTARPNHATMTFSTYYYQPNPAANDEFHKGWKRQFFTTALHEMFHAVGLGSLWNGEFRVLAHIPNPIGGGGINVPLAVATNFNFPFGFEYNYIGTGDPNNARYTASYARAEYRAQMGTMTGGVWSNSQSGVGSIPIENFDGNRILPWNTIMADAGGTALSHWRGSYSNTLSGIVNNKGQDSINEIFTSWSARNEGRLRWVGRYTIGALRDIGYSVNYAPCDIAIADWKTA